MRLNMKPCSTNLKPQKAKRNINYNCKGMQDYSNDRNLADSRIKQKIGKNVEFLLIENIFSEFFKKLKVSDCHRKSEIFRLQREI